MKSNSNSAVLNQNTILKVKKQLHPLLADLAPASDEGDGGR